MINADQLRIHVIRPTLEYLDMWSQSAENLLMGTAAVESDMGFYLRQKGCTGNTGAFGIYQMELATEKDIHRNYLRFRGGIAEPLSHLGYVDDMDPDFELGKDLTWNVAYATAMSRIHYLRVPESLPDADDKMGLAQYWKAHYNTNLGKGTVEKFLDKYESLVLNI